MNIGISAIHVRPGISGSHEPYMVQLVNALSAIEMQHEVTLFVTSSNQHLFEEAKKKFNFVIYPKFVKNVFARIIFEQVILPLDARRRGIDTLHYAGTAGSLFMSNRDVVTIHHDSKTQRQSMGISRNSYYDLVLRINRQAGLIITPTQAYADELIDYYGYNSKRMRPVHHGVNPKFRDVSLGEVISVKSNWGIGENAILTVANTKPHKNIPNLVRAFHILLQEYQMVTQLIMIGNLDQILLDKIIGEITPDIEFLRTRFKVIPFLPHTQLPPFYASAAVFAFVSKVETFGMPLVEAMACGMPIVASDIPVHKEVLQGAARMVSPNDPEDIAAALYSVLSDKKERNRLRDLANTRSTQFSWDITAQKTLRVYEEAGS